MNIYLIPYNFTRYVVVGLYTGGAALMTWWLTLFVIVVVGPVAWDWGFWWSQSSEGVAMLANLSAVLALCTMWGEGELRRRKLPLRIATSASATVSVWVLVAAFTSTYLTVKPWLGSDGMREVLQDTSLVSLRYRMLPFVVAGMLSGLSPWVLRNLQGAIARRWGWFADGVGAQPAPSWTDMALSLFNHVGGGAAAAMLGAAVWHIFGLYDAVAGDLYVGSGLCALVWGSFYGLLVWGIPDDLYAGWLRVLSTERYGLRIPIPHIDGSPAERFVGHFPRGLDLFLPVEQGVAELHLSVVVDERYRYAVRGLSVQPTLVRRFLERIDLRYDPMRPAPLETQLSMEDRVFLGEAGASELEFILLPKEER